jgi:5-methylcytosine-specific restriction endonuclease McrA
MSESACGGASSGSTSDDNSSSVECPTCGRDDFKNTHGLHIHHTRAHGESISWTTKTCDTCGDDVEIEKYELESQDSVYCSTECQYEAYTDKREVECENCGACEKVIPSRADRYRFCSKECKGQYESANWRGENGPNYRGRIEKTCVECGDSMELRPSRKERMFCDESCKGEWWSRQFSGEKHPNWKGGWSEYYGPNWNKKRRQARIRDQSRCQLCERTPLDTGEEMSVHHRTPIRKFQQEYDSPEWWERANKLNNLVCLCRECHSKVEQMAPLSPV